MSCATNWPKNGHPAASVASDAASSSSVAQSHRPPARPNAYKNDWSASKAGSSGNSRAYDVGPIAPLRAAARDGPRQCVNETASVVFMRVRLCAASEPTILIARLGEDAMDV